MKISHFTMTKRGSRISIETFVRKSNRIRPNGNVILHWREEGCIGNYAPRGPRDLPKYWFCTPRPEKLPEGDAQEQSRGPNYQNYQSISVQSCSFQYNPLQPKTRWCFLCEDSEMKNFIPENVVDRPWLGPTSLRWPSMVIVAISRGTLNSWITN